MKSIISSGFVVVTGGVGVCGGVRLCSVVDEPFVGVCLNDPNAVDVHNLRQQQLIKELYL